MTTKKQIVWDDETFDDHLNQTTRLWATVDGRRIKFFFTMEVVEDKQMPRCIAFSEDLIQHNQLPNVVTIKNGPSQSMTFC